MIERGLLILLSVLCAASVQDVGWGVAPLALLFAYAAIDVERGLAWVDIAMLGVLAIGLRQTIGFANAGPDAPSDLIAAGIELTFPFVWWWSTSTRRAQRETRVEMSRQSPAPAEDLWRVFSDFGGVAQWHPYMENATLDEGPHEGIGASRICRFGPRMAIRETVREWHERGMVIAIEFLEGPPSPLLDVHAAVRVESLPQGSRLVLSMRFRTRWGMVGTLAEPLLVAQYRDVFDGMLDAATRWAESQQPMTPRVMPMSGRRLAA